MPADSGSGSLGINESYVQSDIAEIIGKMYSPDVDVQRNITNDGCCKDDKQISRDQEICWKEDEKVNKRFGYYFETESRNHVVTMVDSSTSGSVSLPSIRHKLRRSGSHYACRCCRRKISNRLHQKSSTCGNCKLCAKTLPYQSNVHRNHALNDSGVSREDEMMLEKYNPISLNTKPSTIINRKHSERNGNFHQSTAGNDGDRREQIHTKEPEVALNKNPSRTLLRRVFYNLIGLSSVDKNMPQRDIEESSKNVEVNKNQECQISHRQAELGEQTNKLPCQSEQSCESPKAKKQSKRRGCRNLAANRSQINAILSKDYKGNGYHKLRSSQEYFEASSSTVVSKSQNNHEKSPGDAKRSSPGEIVSCKSEEKSDQPKQRGAGEVDEAQPKDSKSKLDFEQKFTQEINHSKSLFPPTPERADVYCFDFGNRQFYRTTDRAPPLTTDLLVEQNDEWATQFWARVFGHGHLVLAFLTAFALQLLRFVLHGLVRPLVWGTLQLTSDYCLKPCLAVLFNGLLQPVLILLQNIACSLRDIGRPVAETLGFFVGEVARLLRACRLVEIRKGEGVEGKIP